MHLRQNQIVCVCEVSGKDRLRVSVIEKSKQSQVQSLRREGDEKGEGRKS